MMIRLFGLCGLVLLMAVSSGCGGGEPSGSAASGDKAAEKAGGADGGQAEAGDAGEAKASAARVQEVAPERARTLVQQREDLLVLDIRTPDEFKQGHIAGAKNVDFYGNGFEQKLRNLAKDQPVLLHCESGGRSAKARDLMRSLGFEKVYHFGGGMKAWRKEGYPLVKPDAGQEEGSQ